mmetsp:Transcript_124607/g.216002  ORF Transcript_124607/g.216002 Transcript_124607/m.216002 type:complete len:250 (-) Transcript_124607:422-1171(-)
MGCRVGGGDVHGVAPSYQLHRDGCSSGGLSHPSLPHDHDQAMAGLRNVIDQGGQRFRGKLIRGHARVGWGLRGHRAILKEVGDVLKAHHVKRLQGKLGHDLLLEVNIHARQCLLPVGLSSRCHPVGGALGLENPVDDHHLIGQAHAIELPRASCSLFQRCDIGAGNQHNHRGSRVGEARQSPRESDLVHLHGSRRAQARITHGIVVQEGIPCRWQAKQTQGVTRRCRVKDDVVEALGISTGLSIPFFRE